MDGDILIQAEGVSKKFCSDLKRSLAYGVHDILGEFNPFKSSIRSSLRMNEFWANDDVSFTVRRGQCLGLIGRNGAGKSTLLKLLNGLIKPDGGRIKMRGRIAALIELGAGFNPLLTGLENIYINGAVLGLSRKEIDNKLDSIIEFSEIGDFVKMPVQSYSSGMKVRLGFAVAVHLEPDILLLDEILAVGDAAFRAKCFNTITEISRRAAVVFVSHFMPEVASVCDSLLVLKKGRCQYLGNDVPKGIDHYHEIFEGDGPIEVHAGKARLREIRLQCGDLNYSHGEICKLKAGTSLIVCLEVDIKQQLAFPAYILTLHDVAGRPIAQCVSGMDNDLPESLGPGTLEAKAQFNYLPLAPGRYSLSVTCIEMRGGARRGEVYFKVDHAAILLVTDSFPGYTPIQLLGNWSQT